MAKYIIVDAANLFFRCLHGSQGDPFSKAGLSLHIIFRSIRKLWRDHKADHVVFCLEGKSWRYEVYPKYKAARKVARNLATPKERDEGEIYQQALDELIEFLVTKTNVTVLQKNRVEGDDWVLRWPQIHPDDEHLIVSGDSDFIQGLADNVSLYDGVRDLLITTKGVFNAEGQPMEFNVKGGDGKLKVGKELDLLTQDFDPMPEWWRYALFVKCIRGDSGDGIFSAYPRVQEKKLRAAWDDRLDVGYNWNNLMLQEISEGKDENGKEIRTRVLDKYNFNQKLIDLTQQPDDIKELMDATIIEAVQKPRVTGVGIHLLKFCNANGLVNIGKEAGDHAEYLNAPYSK
jgi:hypothetical protein